MKAGRKERRGKSCIIKVKGMMKKIWMTLYNRWMQERKKERKNMNEKGERQGKGRRGKVVIIYKIEEKKVEKEIIE